MSHIVHAKTLLMLVVAILKKYVKYDHAVALLS